MLLQKEAAKTCQGLYTITECTELNTLPGYRSITLLERAMQKNVRYHANIARYDRIQLLYKSSSAQEYFYQLNPCKPISGTKHTKGVAHGASKYRAPYYSIRAKGSLQMCLVEQNDNVN